MVGEKKESLHKKPHKSVVYYRAAMHHRVLNVCFHAISHLASHLKLRHQILAALLFAPSTWRRAFL